MALTSPAVTNSSMPTDKIALFRELFRGRTDIYPRRFESRRTGRSGYSPACANEWAPGICEKPRVRCADCRHRRFLPVTDEVIRMHLTGVDASGQAFVAGVYPLMQDDTCFFLAIDFDKHHWFDDIHAVQQTCQRLHIPSAIERSRSGLGGHLWIFFQDAVPAAIARRLGAHLLTETMESRPELGLDSYDRLFPGQDTLPSGGFGNLIALPLQKNVRISGHSEFISESGKAWPDQWAFLSSLSRMPRRHLETIVQAAATRGRIMNVRVSDTDDEEAEPWNLRPSRPNPVSTLRGPVPERLRLTLSDQIYAERCRLTPALHNQMLRIAAFQNPEFYRAQAMRFPVHDKPRIISCAEVYAEHIALPRGCLEEFLALLSSLNVEVSVDDRRNPGTPIDVVFQGTLREEQEVAVRRLMEHDTGVLSATTAFGKTVVAARMVAERGVNALVLVHRRQLADQWITRLSTFLNLTERDIGCLGGGRRRLKGRVDVGVIQSFVRKDKVHDAIADYGHLIVDECHHLSARSFELVVRRAKARYVLGLSATVTRKDGHHPIVFMQCGPVRCSVEARAAAEARPFDHRVLVRPTSFLPVAAASPDLRVQFQDLYRDLIADTERNRLIVDDVRRAVQQGRSPIVLTERKEHIEVLRRMLAPHIPNLCTLYGGMSHRRQREAKEQFDAVAPGDGRVLLATGKYAGEGLDDARLDTLFLTLPVSWRGIIAQYVGRLHRVHDGKTEVLVYDYADLNVPLLSRMFDRRCRGYEAVGYEILIPGSAVPGWPPGVNLPVERQWKVAYSESVRRLVHDGVDEPLARLFADVATPIPADADGADRARSASEAFLYQRLSTLKETTGQFQLNTTLQIPFDGRGQMEVDLLHRSLPLVIELDGGQHFQSLEAWRRDRRKDALLQEHGYFVLRFLAEDLGTQLSDVLDRILHAITHLRRE